MHGDRALTWNTTARLRLTATLGMNGRQALRRLLPEPLERAPDPALDLFLRPILEDLPLLAGFVRRRGRHGGADQAPGQPTGLDRHRRVGERAGEGKGKLDGPAGR